jgi:phenylacetate-coenzyme A ligase PaaK-like adenylate-forming protein
MTFCEPGPKSYLSDIFDLAAIETGNRKARDHWQRVQLRNLLSHCVQRSAFWRQRVGTRKVSDVTLPSLPVLDRAAVIRQIADEGPLLQPGDQIGIGSNSTSGSSGVPVRFFVSEMNGRYNQVRSATQYFLEGLDLSLNTVQFGYSTRVKTEGLKVTKRDGWLGPLSPMFRCGTYKLLEYYRPDARLIEELERDPIGYLVAAHWGVEALLQFVDPAVLKRAGLRMWIPLAGAVDPKLREAFTSQGIPVRATYSAEEVGPIAFECEHVAGNYHVATSNVIVEIGADEHYQVGSRDVGRVLVTHLHSYATPFIRYDIGDIASLSPACQCGHDGPTLANVYGRGKNLLKHADGTISPFYVRASEIAKIVECTEYRIRQTRLGMLVVEIGGRTSLAPEEAEGLAGLLKAHAGDEFEIEVKAVPEIDWRGSGKRLGFYNEVL